ncbi:MAG: tetratricopeptide repeat protein [Desulfovibrionaceae bacterium]|nr:tetratricopeptide repeat protein [Desulfovibrionaceae bacterium]
MEKALLADQDVSLLLEIANMACHMGFPADALKMVEGILEFKPNFVPALITKAYAFLVVDKFDEALDLLDPILKANPADNDAWVMQGLVLLLSKRRSEALESFEHIAPDSQQKTVALELSKALA